MPSLVQILTENVLSPWPRSKLSLIRRIQNDTEEVAVGDFVLFKANQRKLWAGYAANEDFTTVPAGEFVIFARVSSGVRVPDVACGTGVVAVTAARAGAKASGVDLTPVLLERARENARLVEVDFTEEDAEALPYAGNRFDVVPSQFAHMFAPRPEIATSEMLPVLRPRGPHRLYDLASGTYCGTPFCHDVALCAIGVNAWEASGTQRLMYIASCRTRLSFTLAPM